MSGVQEGGLISSGRLHYEKHFQSTLLKCLSFQNNKLSSLTSGGSLADLNLLTLLDLSSNNFKQLPDNINFLENLQVSAPEIHS